MGRTNYGKSRITGKKDHWWNETHAECTKCKKVFKHSDFHGRKGRGKRPVAPTCKPCTSDIEFAKRRKDTVLTKYKHLPTKDQIPALENEAILLRNRINTNNSRNIIEDKRKSATKKFEKMTYNLKTLPQFAD